jgi:hypothetical protein
MFPANDGDRRYLTSAPFFATDWSSLELDFGILFRGSAGDWTATVTGAGEAIWPRRIEWLLASAPEWWFGPISVRQHRPLSGNSAAVADLRDSLANSRCEPDTGHPGATETLHRLPVSGGADIAARRRSARRHLGVKGQSSGSHSLSGNGTRRPHGGFWLPPNQRFVVAFGLLPMLSS